MRAVIEAEIERFALARPFRIARGERTHQIVVSVALHHRGQVGLGECTPYPRYGETPESVLAQIEAAPRVTDRQALREAMPPGAARNALDAAWWDLEAKRGGRRVWDIAGLPAPQPAPTFTTVSLDEADAMADAARRIAGDRLKIKLGAGDGRDADRIKAIRSARPDATLIVDANEGWTVAETPALLAAMKAAGVAMVEQPLPVGEDAMLSQRGESPPVFADESLHTAADLPRLQGLYDGVNVKLDKTGGLTEGLETVAAARDQGFGVMLGCMVCTSLAIAPATLLAGLADYVDLDGPLWLAADRAHGLRFADGRVGPPDAALWG